MSDTLVTLTLRAQNHQGETKNATAAELAAALTFAHRILNRLASEATEAQPAKRSLLDTIREEPSAVDFEIKSASNGSVVIAGIMAIAGDPFAQGIAGGIVSNVLTPKILAAAEKTKGLFRRPARASAGRIVQLELDIQSSTTTTTSNISDASQETP